MADGQPRPPRFEERACALCGEVFRTGEPMRKYCSTPCQVKATEARRLKRKHRASRPVDISWPKEGG